MHGSEWNTRYDVRNRKTEVEKSCWMKPNDIERDKIKTYISDTGYERGGTHRMKPRQNGHMPKR